MAVLVRLIQVLKKASFVFAKRALLENTAKKMPLRKSAPKIRFSASAAGAPLKMERRNALVMPDGTEKTAKEAHANRLIPSSTFVTAENAISK